MDFALTEEQTLLKDSLTRFLADEYDFEARKGILASLEGMSGKIWSGLAELGLLALPFAEEDGGFGGGPVETMLVMEALGRALVVEPYLADIVLAGAVLRHGVPAGERAALISGMLSGETRIALAHAEHAARGRIEHVETRVIPSETGFRLTGIKNAVPFGASADEFIVSARDEAGRIGLYRIARGNPGLRITDYRLHDGARAADIQLADAVIPRDAQLSADGLPALQAAYAEAMAALVAEAFGVMDEAVAMTVDYLKTRQQFGVAIGTFQALQHRAADMFVALEQARSMMFYAIMMLSEPDLQACLGAQSAAKIAIAKAARFIGQQAVQLHGGIGVTMEYKLGHLFKRLTVIEQQFGDRAFHLDRLAAGESLLEPL